MNWDFLGVSIAVTFKALALIAPALLAALVAASALFAWRRVTDHRPGQVARPAVVFARSPGSVYDTVVPVGPLAGLVVPRAPRAPPIPSPAQFTPPDSRRPARSGGNPLPTPTAPDAGGPRCVS